MEIAQSRRDDCVVLAFSGRLGPASAPEVRRRLRSARAERPAALLVDLSGVRELDPAPAATLAGAGRPVLLCGPRPEVAAVLTRVDHRAVALFASVDDALAAVRSLPPFPRRELRLAPVLGAAVEARSFVARVCREWGLGQVADQARLVASELVTNGVLHTRGPVVLRLELRDRALYVAVRDRSRLRPLVGHPPVRAESGRGLLVVDRLAGSWGTRPHPGGGKVVWSLLDA